MITIWIVWWMVEKGDTPEITVFSDQQLAQECYLKHFDSSYQCDIDEFNVYQS